jgi:predicted transcriptional regulator
VEKKNFFYGGKMKTKLPTITREKQEAVMALVTRSPGASTEQVIDHLKSLGISGASYHRVRTDLAVLRKRGLIKPRMLGKKHMARSGWVPTEGYVDPVDVLKERITELLRASETGLTSVELLSQVRARFNPVEKAQDVKNALWSLMQSKASEVQVVDRLHNKSNGTMVNVYGLEHSRARSGKDEDELRPAKTWGHAPDAWDHLRNNQTLAEISQEHLAAVLVAAERMKQFRTLDPPGKSVSGEKAGPNRLDPDGPIRELFKHARNDQLEARYTALALYISWQEDAA